MASRKHHKQDSTRPTKARVKRMRDHGQPPGIEVDTESERSLEVAPASNADG